MLHRWWARALCAVVVWLASLWALRRAALHWHRRKLARDPKAGSLGLEAETLVGEIAIVEQAMLPGAQGQVAIGGTVYLARNVGRASLPVGITCRIVAMDHLGVRVNGDG